MVKRYLLLTAFASGIIMICQAKSTTELFIGMALAILASSDLDAKKDNNE